MGTETEPDQWLRPGSAFSIASERPKTEPETATRLALQIFCCYRRDEAVNPDIFVAAASAVLASYPMHIGVSVASPVTGLPSRLKWLPSIAEIKEACEDQMVLAASLEDGVKKASSQISKNGIEPWMEKYCTITRMPDGSIRRSISGRDVDRAWKEHYRHSPRP